MTTDRHDPYCRAWRADGEHAVFCALDRSHRGQPHEFIRQCGTVAEAQAEDEAAGAGFEITGRDPPESDEDTLHFPACVGTFDGAALLAQAEALEERIRREDGLAPGPLLTHAERSLRAQETLAAAARVQALIAAVAVFPADRDWKIDIADAVEDAVYELLGDHRRSQT